jgi:AraC-like DNA-binding protein
VSRSFVRVFGITPKAFRAWNRLIRSAVPLTAIAHGLEFADLVPASRSISALTGHAPSAWRAACQLGRQSSPFKRVEHGG